MTISLRMWRDEDIMKTLNRTAVFLLATVLAMGCSSSPDVKGDHELKNAKADTTKLVKKPAAPKVSREAKDALVQAVKAYKAQRKSGHIDYEDLLDRFKAVLEVDPKMAEAHYNLGCIYEAMRDDDNAQKHYKRALEIRPDLYVAAANWGALLARKGKRNEALAIYKKALSKDAKNSPVLLNMAGIYRFQKKLDLALKHASEVLVRDPTNIGAYRIMASVYYDMGKFDMARLICLRGLKVKEKDPSLLNTLGLVLLKIGDVPEALANFHAALKQQPDMLPTRFNIAKVALDYKDFQVAKDQFTKILEYDPNNHKASMGLAIALRGTGELDAAKAKFEQLAKKYPKATAPQQWLCRMALRNFNDPKSAKKECRLCIKRYQLRSGDRDNPCVAMYKEAMQGIEMEKKMKEAEAKALEEQKRYEKLMARLAKLRKDTVDKAWDRAKKNCGVLPPKKLDTSGLEFVLDPLAVTPDKKTKVKLVGALFKNGVKRVNVGTLKVKWHKLDDHTLEIMVPKGLDLGPWDILITFKDKSEMFFGGGLWVGKKPKCESKTPPAGKDEAGKKTEGKKQDAGKKASAKGEPSSDKAVKVEEGAKPPVETGKKNAGKTEETVKKDNRDVSKSGKKDEKGADEPRDPDEPSAP